MNRSYAAVRVALAALLLASAACAAMDASPPPPPLATVHQALRPPPPFGDGERADYLVTVLGIPAATGVVGTARTPAGWVFEARADARPWLNRFYPLSMRMRAAVDGASLRPRRLHRSGVNGAKSLRRAVRFGKAGRARVDTRVDRGKNKRRRRRTTADAYDPLGLVFAMRWTAESGDLDGSVWHAFDGAWTRRLSVRVRGKETVEVPAGRFRCVRLEVRVRRVQVKGDRRIPDTDDRTWTVWVSDDARHRLVAAEGSGPFGPARATLTSWRDRPQVAALGAR